MGKLRTTLRLVVQFADCIIPISIVIRQHHLLAALRVVEKVIKVRRFKTNWQFSGQFLSVQTNISMLRFSNGARQRSHESQTQCSS